MNKTLLLFIVIILEGYVVLSAEMLAIRQTISFVGSGTDTVSIIIAAVLMPLAFGYHAGGHYKSRATTQNRSIRRKLVFNIIVAQAIFMLGLSYYPLNLFFFSLMDIGIRNRLLLTALYSLIFLVTPVYLLGQTIPLVSNYFSKKKLAEITGRMLFFSTMGSFLGAVFSTLILMAYIGVHHTVSILSVMLSLLAILLSRRNMRETVLFSITVCIFTFMLNSDHIMQKFHIVSDNKYNTVMAFEDAQGNRQMVLNMSASSMYNDEGRKHKYIEFMERQVLFPILSGDNPPKDILVIGAGAFTFGFEDQHNNYDFVDLDASLKDIAEKYILRAKLGGNKHFNPVEARAFLMNTDKKYDLIILDAYNGDLTLPEQLVTRDFYAQVRKHLKDGGVVAANFIVSPDFESPFSRHIDDTFRSVFPYVSRYALDEGYQPWNTDPNAVINVIYIYRRHADENPVIYTDNKNPVFYDKPHAR